MSDHSRLENLTITVSYVYVRSIYMTFSFTPIIGGALIGLSATILLAFHGKVAGISGIFSGALSGEALSWRAPFLLGLLASGVIVPLTGDQLGLHEAFSNSVPRTLWVTGLAGLLVGFGTRLGSGCTSGHGICGLGRASKRSLAATLTFMFTGAVAAFVTQHLIFDLIKQS